MGRLVFVAIAVAYLYYASKERVNAIAGGAVLLPYNQYLPSSGLPLLNIQILVIGGALWALVRGSDRKRSEPPASFPVALPIFVGIVVLQYAHSFFATLPSEYRYAYNAWANFLNFKEWMCVLFLASAAFVIVRTPREMVKVFVGASIGFGFEIVFCMLEFMLRSTKVTGHLEVRNATGAFLATYAVGCLGAYVGSKGWKYRLIYLGLAFAGTLGALGTRSRGAVLALGGAAALIALMKSRILFVLLVVAGINYQMWMPQPILDRFSTAVTVDNAGELEAGDTAAEREEIWKAGFRTIPDYPLGLGFGVYSFVVPKYGLEGLLTRPIKNAHNDVVLVTVELSVIGLAVYLLLLATMAKRAWKVARKDVDPELRGIGMAACGALVGVMAAGVAGNFIFRLDISGILWILLGTCARRADVLTSVLTPAPARAAPRPTGPAART